MARLAGEGADDLREHPHVAAEPLARRAPRAPASSKTRPSSSFTPERVAEEEDRVLQRRAHVVDHRAQARAQLVLGRAGVGGRQVVLEGAPHLEPQVGGEPGERALDADEAVPLGEQLLVARRDVARGHAEEIALEALGEQPAGAPAEVVGERARVAAQHREDQVGAPGDAAIGVVERRWRRGAAGSGACGRARGT